MKKELALQSLRFRTENVASGRSLTILFNTLNIVATLGAQMLSKEEVQSIRYERRQEEP